MPRGEPFLNLGCWGYWAFSESGGSRSGQRVWALGFTVTGLGFRVEALGFRLQGLGFRVSGREKGSRSSNDSSPRPEAQKHS